MPSASRLSRWRRIAAGVSPSLVPSEDAVDGPSSRISRATRARVPRSDPPGSGTAELPAAVTVAPGAGSAVTLTYFTTSVWRKSFLRRNTNTCDCPHIQGAMFG